MIDKFTAGAGSLTVYREHGDFFRLLETTGKVTIYFYRQGREVARADDISGGYAEKFSEPFDEIAIESLVVQDVQFAIRLGNVVSYDSPPKGQVVVTNTGGQFSNKIKTVGVASGQLFGARAGRRYLLVQNNHQSAEIFISLDGLPAVTAGGIRVNPGSYFELNGFCCEAEINAIAWQSNGSIIICEGW